MTRSIGWWDYDESDRPTLINRDSGERLRMGDVVKVQGRRLGQSWRRFDYLHHDLEFPLVICWTPEEGRIVVDYDASIALWREESNTDILYPPYGTWVRVDDRLIDAIWSWPGVYECQSGSGNARRKRLWIGRAGGWCNGKWWSNFQRFDRCATNGSQFTGLNGECQYSLDKLVELQRRAPSPWRFIGVDNEKEYRDLQCESWNGRPLFVGAEFDASQKKSLASEKLEQSNRGTVAVGNMVPQLRSDDGGRIFHPNKAVVVPDPYCDTEDYLYFKYGDRDFGQISLTYWRQGLWDEVEEKLSVLPHFYFLGLMNERRREVMEHDVVQVDQERPYPRKGSPQFLSLCDIDLLQRDVIDAFLSWEGTSSAPSYWGANHGRYLTYEKPEFIQSNQNFVGGVAAPVERIAALKQSESLKATGIDSSHFDGECQ